MAVRYEIVPGVVARITMTGVVGPSEVIASLRTLAADPEYQNGMPQLVDMRGVTQAAPVADLERVAYAFEQMRPQFFGARCAVMVASAAVFGSVRQFGTLAERAGLDVTPFLNAERARAWLGVEQNAGSDRGEEGGGCATP